MTETHLETTLKGRIMRADEAFCSLVGRTEDELAGVMLVDLLPAGDRIYFESFYAPLLRISGRASEVALSLERPDGTRTAVLLTAEIERTASGRPHHVRCRVERADG